MFTATVTERLSDPPAPVAVNVYVVELVGVTERLPLDCTVPTPPSIETSVALVTLQRSVADSPRPIRLGSAVKLPILGFAGGGAGAGATAAGAGAGGGATGTFLWHAAPNSRSTPTKTLMPAFFTSDLCRFIFDLCPFAFSS